MKVLILGGTGAMGVPLVESLSKDNEVFVTSRTYHPDKSNVTYIQGNGVDKKFLRTLLNERHWDAVIDFMVRTHDDLEEIIDEVLDSTDQYIFISSARVYAESNELITEETPRLLDVCQDKEYLKTDEYALAKAREENVLFNSPKQNFTIIRPSITYNDYRLQLGVFEKEEWLNRALYGDTLVFSRDLMDKTTTMTHGDDVAAGIAAIVGKRNALGKAFHITSPVSLKWSEVLKIYVNAIKELTGRTVKVKLTEKSTNFIFPQKKYQLIYCRYFNRRFDNSRINDFIDTNKFLRPEVGLERCLSRFVKSPKFLYTNFLLEGVHDRLTGDRGGETRVKDKKDWIIYQMGKWNLMGVYRFLNFINRTIH